MEPEHQTALSESINMPVAIILILAFFMLMPERGMKIKYRIKFLNAYWSAGLTLSILIKMLLMLS